MSTLARCSSLNTLHLNGPGVTDVLVLAGCSSLHITQVADLLAGCSGLNTKRLWHPNPSKHSRQMHELVP